MKKYFTLLVVTSIFLISTSASDALANGSNSSETKKALTILVKQVNRDIINELQLNEMQYIQLRTLNKKYQAETKSLKATAEITSTTLDSQMQDINNKYFAELRQVLTDQQIETYVSKQSVALN